MKHLICKFIVAVTLSLIDESHVYAQERILSEEERQAKLDSIIAETERHFGWNDDAYSAKIAKDKWQSGEAKLLLQGGIAPVVYVGQEQFTRKYGVGYEDFGCMAYCSDRQMAEYNTVIMDYLTANYGSEWRKHVRKDVPGVDKYGAEAFKKMKYDENGVATITIPVIYRAFGKAVEQSDKDEIAIKELLGCTPATSLEFLYRGKEYYIPLSCNNEIEETPAENELIEVIIRVFNPKVFHYSGKTIPCPYCIVESINLLR